MSGAIEDADAGQALDFGGIFPRVELRGLVGTDEQSERSVRVPGAQLAQGVDRVARRRAMKFQIIDGKIFFARDGETEHGKAVGGGGGSRRCFERRVIRRQQEQAVETEFFERGAGEDEVSVMHGIEAAAEDAESHGATLERVRVV